MLPFDSSIRRLVVWRHEGHLHPQDPLEVPPEACLVSLSIVTNNFLWTTIALQPTTYKTIAAVQGGGRRKRDTLYPFGLATHDGQDEFHPLRLREGAHNIRMKLSESSVRYFENSALWIYFSRRFN